MKKLINLLTGVFLLAFLAVLAFRATGISGYNVQATSLITEAPAPVTVMVRNVSGLDLKAGDVVAWADSISSTTTYIRHLLGVDVSTTTSTGDRLVAGVLTRDLDDNKYGPLAVYGIADINVSVAVSAGDVLVSSPTARIYTVAGSTVSLTRGVAASVDNDADGVGADGVFAISLETDASSTTVKGLIK